MGWPDGWVPLEAGAGQALEDELAKELRRGHALHGRSVRAVGRDTRGDDVLFAIEGSDEVALVHLTWSAKRERPPWPWTALYPSLGDAQRDLAA